MPRFKDQAICIRHIDWSQTSQVVTLLTEQHGKLAGLARGSKRTSPSSSARFSGGIELLTLGQAVGVIKATTDLASITEWDLQRAYPHLRRDLRAHQLGLYAADLVGAMLADRDPHPITFAAMAAFLDQITDVAMQSLGLLCLQWRVLDDCGFRPELERDVVSGQTLLCRATYRFDAQAGGLTMQSLSQDDLRGSWRVRHETVQVLRNLSGGDLAETEAIVINRANRLLCVYTRAILDRELPTMRFVLDARR